MDFIHLQSTHELHLQHPWLDSHSESGRRSVVELFRGSMVGGEREVQKCNFARNLFFEWLLCINFVKKICMFDPQTVKCNKSLFFLQMENWLLINRSFNDDSGKPVQAIAVRSSVLRTFTEDCNSSVSSSVMQC